MSIVQTLANCKLYSYVDFDKRELVTYLCPLPTYVEDSVYVRTALPVGSFNWDEFINTHMGFVKEKYESNFISNENQ